MATHMTILTQDMHDDQRLRDLAQNDPIPESEWIAADLLRARNLKQRELQRVSTAHALDLQEIRRAGL